LEETEKGVLFEGVNEKEEKEEEEEAE